MENLLILRKNIGLTQKEIADRLGISRQAYANYETGNREPDIEVLKALSDLYDVSIDFLVKDEKNRFAISASHEPTVYKTTFPYNLKTQRKKAKITQSDLGKIINVSESTISNYENGYREPDLATLLSIAKALNTSVDRLLEQDKLDIQKDAPSSNQPFTEQEKVLVEIFRQISERKKFEIIAYLMNAQNENHYEK